MSSPGWGGGQAPGWKPGAIVGKIKERRQQRRQSQQQQEAAEDYEDVDYEEDDYDDHDDGQDEILEGEQKGAENGGGGGSRIRIGWYPGKYASKAMKKKASKYLGPPKEESQRRLDGAPVIGRLSLVFKGTIGVKLFNPYFSVWVEGITKNVKPGRFMDDYDEERASRLAQTEPQWDEALYLFDVTDITSDCHITLLDKRLRTFTIGGLIVPLTNFLNLKSPKPPTTYTFDIVAADQLDMDKKMLSQKYAPQMIIPSTTNKKGPITIIGQIVMEIELTTECNLLHTYLLSRPLLEDSFIRRKDSQKKTEPQAEGMDTRQLVINIFRLKQALQAPPLVPLLLDTPIIFVPLFTAFVRSPVWSYPLWCVSTIIANGYLASRSKSIPNVDVWPKGLVQKVYQLESTSAPTKIMRLRSMVKWLQDQLGVIASGLERSSNLWSWVDPHVTLLVEGFLTMVALVLALILYIIPFQFLAWAVGMAVYIKIFLKRKAIRDKPVPKVSIRAKKGTGTGPEEQPIASAGAANANTIQARDNNDSRERKDGGGGGGGGDDDQGAGREEKDASGVADEEDEYEILQFDWRHWVNPRKVLPSLFSNVFVRSPDYMELLHREFAKQRTHSPRAASSVALAQPQQRNESSRQKVE